MTEAERIARYNAARDYRITDAGMLSLLDALMDTVAEEPEPARVAARERGCRYGHPATERNASGNCRACQREKDRKRRLL